MLAISILTATIAAFAWYFRTHPEVIHSLRQVSIGTIVLLFALYCLFMGTLIWIQRATLALCDLKLGQKESALLVMYSSVINFFGPLQSGPAFRAAYLKARYKLNLKKYAVATLTYYGLYALFSGLMILAVLVNWWIIIGAIAAYLLLPRMLRAKRFDNLNKAHIRSLAQATFCQVMVLSAIYFVEIRSLLSEASYLQSLSYTGAANFALFVSITPGAIGFREAFLVFSQSLHGIGSEVIAAASVIDRSIYIILLLIVAAVVTAMHASEYFKVKK